MQPQGAGGGADGYTPTDAMAIDKDYGKAGVLKKILSPIGRAGKGFKRLISWWRAPASAHTYYPELPHKSKIRICIENIYWWIKYREFNQYYYMFGLDCASASLFSRMACYEFCDFRNSKNIYVQGQESFSTPFNYVCLMRDKRLFVQLAASIGIPVPKTLAIYERGRLSWLSKGEVTPLDEIRNRELDLICKPVDGNCGNGIFRLETGNGKLLINGREACDELASHLKDGYLLQERLSQHPELEKFHPSSINTIRLVTFYEEGTVRVGWAALRIGTGGGATDNLAKGGVVVKIALETGKLASFGFQKPKFGRRVSRHPDSGVEFDGFFVPFFAEAVALVKKYHAFVCGIHSIGWDVAITPEGPVLIEGNDDWDGDLVMVIDPAFRTNFMNIGRYPSNTGGLKKGILKAYK